MNDFLTLCQSGEPETREAWLTRQFYEWERRGRGWVLVDFPVELEPPIRPFYLPDAFAGKQIDDGRHSTFFSSLVDRWGSRKSTRDSAPSQQLAEYEAFLAEADEPLFCQYYNEEFTELRLVLPKDLNASKSVAESILLSFGSASHPIAFEVIGNSEQIVVQFAAARKDILQVKQQIKSHLPESVLVETDGHLEEAWLGGGDYGIIADFGLANEFMLPLETSSSADTDLLVSITGALGNLQSSEIGIFQVLFQKAKFGWAEEIMSSVRFFDGTPFFANAPEMIALAKEKVSRPLFAVIVRVAARSRNEDRMWKIAKNLGAGLSIFSKPIGNELIPLSDDGYQEIHQQQSLLNRQSFRLGMILNSDELASIAHPPSALVRGEKIVRESENTKPAPALVTGHSLNLGENIHQNESRQVTLSHGQRTKHIHLIGSTGSGKSTLLLNLIIQDLKNKEGLCVIDPHGDLIDDCLANMPEERIKDVILFDPSDSEFPIGFNILKANSELEKNLLSSDLIATFRRMATSWGDVMDSVLANAILALLESRTGGTLVDLKRFLAEKDFRQEFLKTVEDDAVRYFWHNEFPLISGKPQSSILIRLDSFLRQKLIRNIVCQKDSNLNFRHVMDERKVLLIKLSQGLIGEENAHFLGTLLMSKLYQTALSRQDTKDRPFFWIYLDEFHHFITPSMESILSGVRKYNIGLHLAHQEFRQLQSRDAEVASSVLSNCYTRICFRLGDTDAEKFASGFSFFDSKSLQNLSVGECIARVERAEFDFNLKTSPLPKADRKLAEQRQYSVLQNGRKLYAAPKGAVEAELLSGRAVAEKPIVTKPERNMRDEKGISQKDQRAEKTEPLNGIIENRTDNSHRYLQSIIKRIGENNGFLATIEKQVFGGIGKVDVALENETLKIACEIAVTNTTDYELQNIQKCLAAGFDKVIVVSPNIKHLASIKGKTESVLSESQLQKISFLEPDYVHLFLEKMNAESDNKANRENKVKGYKITTDFKTATESETEMRKQTVFEILKSVIKRTGKK